MSRLNRNHRRALEQELRDVPTPPPPGGLFDRIRQEIPSDLAAANAVPAQPAHRRWYRGPALGVAATLAVAVLGATLAYRTLEPKAARDAARAGDTGAIAKPVTLPEPARQQPKVVGETAPVRAEAKDEKRSMMEKTEAPLPQDSAPAMAAPQRRVSESDDAEGLEASASPPPPAAAAAEAQAVTTESELRSLGYVADSGAPLPLQRRVESAPAVQAAPSPKAVAGARGGETGIALGGRNRSNRETEESVAHGYAAPGAGAPPSTGGEREPNEQAVGDMFFRPTGTNPFVDTAEDRLSTFALDVDTGSYTLARSYLERGVLPPAAAVRVEEFVNAQRYDDPAPRRGEFTLTAEGAPSPFAPGERYRLVRFAVRARDVAGDDRKPAVLTFVIDVSGSMDRENRLGLVKRALGLLLDELGDDDRVGLVVYGTRGRVLLEHTRDHEEIRAAIRRLVPEGSTNAEEGLRLAYDLADRGWRSGAINRVILCSDGVANVGATGPESILDRIGSQARRGIALTTVGFGMGNYNDALMEQLADQGDGSYHYVDALDEARKVFVENLTGTLQTVAKDAKVQVEFEPRAVERWRLLGYENRDVADRDFRNDRIDAGEVGAGTAVTALYEVRLARGARDGDRLATLRLRWRSVDGGGVAEAHQDLAVGDLGGSFRRATRDLRVAAVAAELAEQLEGSYYARENDWSDLAAEAHALARDERGDASVGALAALVERAARLASRLDPDPDRDDDRPGDAALEVDN